MTTSERLLPVPVGHKSGRVFLVSLAVLLIRSACPGPLYAGWVEDADGKTIIHVEAWELPDPNNPAANVRADVATVKLFKKRFPQMFAARRREKYKANPQKYGRHNWDNVEIEFHKSTGIRIEGVEVDLLQIAGDMAPDILYVNFRKSDNYIQAGFLYPLDRPEDGYLGDLSRAEITGKGISGVVGGMEDEAINFRIHPTIWPVIWRKGPDGNKQIWAIPYGGALGKVLLFRKDLFDKHKIPYPTVDWTWDHMMDAARKITNPEQGIYGLYLTRSKHESWYWITFLWSAGGEVMVYNEKTDSWRCTFDTHEAAVALDFYTRLSAEKWVDENGKIRRGYSSKDAGQVYYKWERGEIGMLFDYVDEKMLSSINPEVTGMAPVPLGPTGKRGAELNSRMMGLFSGIKHPAVRDAAWEYIRFFDCREAVELKTKIMVEGGFGRFLHPKYLRMFGYPEIERLSPKGWAECFEIAIATGKPEPYGRNSNVAYDLMTYPIQKAEQMMLNDELPENREERLKVMHELLRDANRRANEEMIGIVSPQERTRRRAVAAIVLLAIVVSFSLGFRKILRLFTPPVELGRVRKAWDFRRYFWAYVLLMPAVGLILVWQYVPLIRGSAMAFFDYQILRESTWVGIDNFGDLIFNNAWWASVWNALRYSFLVMALTFLPPIALAILLQEVPRGKILFRTIYYLPAVITGMVTVLMWKQFYDPSERGALNAILLKIPAIGFVAAGTVFLVVALAFARRLRMHEMNSSAWGFVGGGVLLFLAFGSLAGPILFPAREAIFKSLISIPSRLFMSAPEPRHWLANPDTAMFCCVLPMVWAGMGPGCLIYLAALKGIPDDYYEAADIDGANFIDKILFVVFPMLKALIVINFVGVFIGSWYTATGTILMMTGGASGTEVAGLHIWYKAFTYLKFGPATAMAWMLGFMLIGFTVHQLQILSRVEFRTTGSAKE